MTEDDVRAMVFSNNADIQQLHQQFFKEEIDQTLGTIAQSYTEFVHLQNQVDQDIPKATVQMFLHSAFNSLISSLHFFVSGYPVASGHMMRHFMESLAMAFLCSDSRTGVLEAFNNNRTHFSIQKAPNHLRKKEIRRVLEDRFGFDSVAWEKALEIAGIYDALSHAGVTSLAYQMTLTGEEFLVLGASFDEGKLDEYKGDVTRRRTAAEAFAEVVPAIMTNLIHGDIDLDHS